MMITLASPVLAAFMSCAAGVGWQYRNGFRIAMDRLIVQFLYVR